MFKTIIFKTKWDEFSKQEKAQILDAQKQIRKEYERIHNPKTVYDYIAEGFFKTQKAAQEAADAND